MKIHDACNSAEFKNRTREIYHEFIPDAKSMVAAACARQVNDYHEGVNNSEELGITIQVSQIFVKEGRDLQRLANALQQQVVDVVRKSQIEGVSVFTEVYASVPDGQNHIFWVDEWVS